MRPPDRRTLAAVAVLAAAPALFFGRALLHGRTLCYDDLSYWFYPWKALLHRQAMAGHVSLWLPYEFCGMPHMADIQRQIFYPPNAIFYVAPTWIAMVVFVAFHFALGGILMYLYLRDVGEEEEMSHLAATAGGLVFAFSSFPVLHLTQLPVLSSYAWIPGLLLVQQRYWRTLSWTAVAQGAVVFAMMVLGGAPQIVYIASTLAAVCTVPLVLRALRTTPPTRVTVALAALVAVPLLGLALCALQLLPMAELASYSSRQAVPPAYSTIGTAPPHMVWSLLAPYAWGNPAENTWTGGDYMFHEQCMYAGFLTLVLAAAALGDSRRFGRAWFYFGVAACGVLMALGNHVALGGFHLHDVLRGLLPLFGRFRVPARWLIWTVVGLSVLAALGVQALTRYRVPRERNALHSWLPLIAAAAALFALDAAVIAASRAHGTMAHEALWIMAMSAVGVVACAATRFGSGRAWMGAAALVVILGGDLLFAASRYVRETPAGQISDRFNILRQLAADPTGPLRIATTTTLRTPTEVATWCPPLGLANIQGTNPLFLVPYVEYLFFSQAGSLPPVDQTGLMHHNGFFVIQPHLSPMTRLLNLHYALEVDPRYAPGEGLADPRHLRARGIARPIGVVTAVRDFTVIPEHALRLALMFSSSFEPTREVIFESDPGVRLDGSDGPAHGTARVLEYTDDRIVVESRLDRGAFLLFSEIYYPGWRARVDGHDAVIRRADDIFRAVAVGRGTHRVEMRFAPASFHLGLTVSLVTSAFLAATTLLWMRRRRP